MILEVHQPPEYVPNQISDHPDADLIETTLKSLPWSDITFVVLKIDDRNFIEVSGSLNPNDGFSARFMNDGIEHVSNRAPESFEEMSALLISYLASDGRWRTLIEWD